MAKKANRQRSLWVRDVVPSLAEIKQLRADAAGAILGVNIECLDFGDSPLLIGPERRQQRIELFHLHRPDIVLSYWKDDIHHLDRCAATEAIIWASRYCFLPGIEGQATLPPCPSLEVFFYETTLCTTPVAPYIPSLLVVISCNYQRKCKALDCFAAQPSLTERYGWLARYRAFEAQSTAWMQGCEYAEGFVRLGTEATGFSGPSDFGPG